MTCKEQNKILDAKIESNVNQYKVDRLNAEISAFSSGDLNKCELLKRIDLNYKPNALDKARLEFSPLGKTFSAGLDKTAQDYQEKGVMKLLKDIRDSLKGGARPQRLNNNRDDNDDNDDMMTMMIMMIMIMMIMMIMIMIMMMMMMMMMIVIVMMMIVIIDLMMKDMIIEFF